MKIIHKNNYKNEKYEINYLNQFNNFSIGFSTL